MNDSVKVDPAQSLAYSRSALNVLSVNSAVESFAVGVHVVSSTESDVYIERSGAEPVAFPHLVLWRELAPDATGASVHLYYDSRHQCWLLTAAVQTSSKHTLLALAASDAENPAGVWQVAALAELETENLSAPVLNISQNEILVSAETSDGRPAFFKGYTATELLGESVQLSRPTKTAAAATNNFDPIPTALTPASGSGRNVIFTASFSDGDGASTISNAYLLIGNILSGLNACYIQYNAATGALGLLNDAGSAYTWVMPGQSQTAGNSQCTLKGTGSSVYVSSDILLKITANVEFAYAFGGSKNVYTYAVDSSGRTSGWYVKGSWTAPNANLAPIVSYQEGNSWVTATDPDGVSDLQYVFWLINSDLTGVGACMVVYNNSTGQIGLMNDAGSAFAYGSAGSNTTLSNSQCSLNLAGIYVMRGSSDLSVGYLTPSYTPKFAGSKRIYVNAVDQSNVAAGWRYVRAVQIGDNSKPQMTVQQITATIDGADASFNASFRTTSGTIDTASVLINNTLTAAGGCYITYDRPSNRIGLKTDDGVGTVYLHNVQVENSQCVLKSAWAYSYDGVELNVSVRFKGVFQGTKNVYGLAASNSGISTDWVRGATVTAPTIANFKPVITGSVLVETATNVMLTAKVTDSNGADDIQSVFLLVNSALTGYNGCYITWNRNAGQLGLYNDNASSVSYVTPGAVGSAQNSQCILDGSRSSVTQYSYDSSITIQAAVRTRFSFGGTHGLYLMAADGSAEQSAWQFVRQFTVATQNTAPVAGNVTLWYTNAQSDGSTIHTFEAVMRDNDGSDTIETAGILFADSLNGVGACFVVYRRDLGKLGLLSDNGQTTSWVTPGTSEFTGNSQCSLYASSSSISKSYYDATTLLLRMGILFKDPFRNTSKSIYTYATDVESPASWRAAGSWISPVVKDPTLIAFISPSKGSAQQQTFSITVPNSSPVGQVWLLFNQTQALAGACSVRYDFATNTVELFTETGTISGKLAASGQLSNSQCTVDTGLSSLSLSYNASLLNIRVNFSSSFTGSKNIWINLSPLGGYPTGWTSAGSWDLPSLNVVPVPENWTSYYTSGTSGTFQLSFTDGNGGETIKDAFFLLNSSLNGVNGCFVVYTQTKLGLLNDAGTVIQFLGDNISSVENSQCTLQAYSGSVTVSGNTLQLGFTLKFKYSFAGAKYGYMQAVDEGGLSSGWQIKGSWTVPPPYAQ